MKQIDRDFFRAMARERADSMPPLVSATHADTMMDIAKQCLVRALNETNHSKAIDALCHLSALCERAAVDLILPNCSTRNKVDALKKSKWSQEKGK
jgi:hypothetical protein